MNAERVHRLSVGQYQRMITIGVFAPDDRVELLDGLLMEKPECDPIRAGTIQLVTDHLARMAPDGWHHRCRSDITLAYSQPEPDLVLVRGMPRNYFSRHPGPAYIGLVVEVSKSRLLFDRTDKLRIYARAGLPMYWIINVVDGQVEVFEQPSGADYASSKVYRRGDSVPLAPDGVVVGSIPAADLLP